MDVMRHLEPVMIDHERLFEAWEAGGVTGLVIGPMAFEDKTFAFDPNPDVYRRFGLDPPRAPRISVAAAVICVQRGWRVFLALCATHLPRTLRPGG